MPPSRPRVYRDMWKRSLPPLMVKFLLKDSQYIPTILISGDRPGPQSKSALFLLYLLQSQLSLETRILTPEERQQEQARPLNRKKPAGWASHIATTLSDSR